VLCLVLALGSCTFWRTRPSGVAGGFLGDYSSLRESASGNALFVYVDQTADFTRYDRVWIEPVSVWLDEDSDVEEVRRGELRALAGDLGRALRRALRADYALAADAGAGTLRLRAALTGGAQATAPVDVGAAEAAPRRRGARRRMSSPTRALVEEAGLELDVLDASSGVRLFALVDREAGARALAGAVDEWEAARLAFAGWADQVRRRLRSERARSELSKPWWSLPQR
jgi:hypothetical protein